MNPSPENYRSVPNAVNKLLYEKITSSVKNEISQYFWCFAFIHTRTNGQPTTDWEMFNWRITITVKILLLLLSDRVPCDLAWLSLPATETETAAAILASKEARKSISFLWLFFSNELTVNTTRHGNERNEWRLRKCETTFWSFLDGDKRKNVKFFTVKLFFNFKWTRNEFSYSLIRFYDKWWKL